MKLSLFNIVSFVVAVLAIILAIAGELLKIWPSSLSLQIITAVITFLSGGLLAFHTVKSVANQERNK